MPHGKIAFALVTGALGFDNAHGHHQRHHMGKVESVAFKSSSMYHRATVHIDKILKGAKPGDIPIERPIRFEFTVNLKTAKTLGIKLPGTIMIRATKVIE